MPIRIFCDVYNVMFAPVVMSCIKCNFSCDKGQAQVLSYFSYLHHLLHFVVLNVLSFADGVHVTKVRCNHLVALYL